MTLTEKRLNECWGCMYPLMDGEEWPWCDRCRPAIEKAREAFENGDVEKAIQIGVDMLIRSARTQ